MSGCSQSPVLTRREFLRGTVRYALLGVIVAATARALNNGRRPGNSCRRQFLCGGCPVAPDCPLPSGIRFRANPSEVNV